MSGSFHGIEIFLQPGEFYFGEADTRIRTLLGSCVAITFWHPERRIGAMCHYLLASPSGRRSLGLDGRYGEDALLMFLSEAVRRDTDPADYVVKIFGGGNMFPLKTRDPCAAEPCENVIEACGNVACRNGMIGRALLRRQGFAIAAEHLGGTGHRNVIFDIASGHVWVRHVPIGRESPCKKSACR